MAKRGRRPQGEESRIVVASTKLTESEVHSLVARHGSVYAGLRVAVAKMLRESK